MSTEPTDTARTRSETPVSTTCMSSPDQDPYSPDISPTVQYIFYQNLIQDEDAEYILPQILGSEEPQTSTPKLQPVQTPSSLAQPPTHNLNQQINRAASPTVAAGTSTKVGDTAGLTDVARQRTEAVPTQTGGPNLDCRDGCGVATAAW
ncbi:Hypothetical predicted protein [Mytilus galloprovincialis]|uniref:Uncharacterized protein n=1 Tax=Mytilus galloprovincialis TaxID=29158 RepID=A0A8B6H9B1_MYTGA|nr:Hypothetical predicted protein [Mytilus galloprovincialis]